MSIKDVWEVHSPMHRALVMSAWGPSKPAMLGKSDNSWFHTNSFFFADIYWLYSVAGIVTVLEDTKTKVIFFAFQGFAYKRVINH